MITLNEIIKKDVLLFKGFREGVCGHLFECFDYYLFFRKLKINCGVYLVYDKLNMSDLEKLISEKYNLPLEEKKEMLQNIYLEDNVSFKQRKIHNFSNIKNIIFVEAHDLTVINNIKAHFFAFGKNIHCVRCGQETHPLLNKDLKIYQDFRIYGEHYLKYQVINHKKRFAFDLYKIPNNQINPSSAFIYLSTVCRKTEKNNVSEIINHFKNEYSKIIFSVENPLEYEDMQSDQFIFLKPPIDNLINLFGTYIYTPITRRFDCSSRLLVECSFFKKKIVFHKIDKGYYTSDIGLYWRKKDCEENLEDLVLTKEDSLIKEVLNSL